MSPFVVLSAARSAASLRGRSAFFIRPIRIEMTTRKMRSSKVC
ncbi:hypothetical protein BSU04_33320 [Caballeronia sordidicola]|uniref:Uncharacterized protein n=1 Tax=Caballeronia sordidicola TaxID=196367 RepID=A0A226WSN6_CABSO|nr:hypothetical protein BSU04_33320 [Caballeronia sordidicola]